MKYGAGSSKTYWNSEPLSLCDFSGQLFPISQIVPQMEYNATGLYDTGYRVGKNFAYKPQPQNLAPVLGVDPKPVIGVKVDTQLFRNWYNDPLVFQIDAGTVMLPSNFNESEVLIFEGEFNDEVNIEIPFVYFTVTVFNKTNSILEYSIGNMYYNKQPANSVCSVSFNTFEIGVVEVNK